MIALVDKFVATSCPPPPAPLDPATQWRLVIAALQPPGATPPPGALSVHETRKFDHLPVSTPPPPSDPIPLTVTAPVRDTGTCDNDAHPHKVRWFRYTRDPMCDNGLCIDAFQ
jgi:hypothetical protein